MKKRIPTHLIGILIFALFLLVFQAAGQDSSITQSASNVANVGSDSVVSQQISQMAVSQYSDFYSMPSGT
ncbi:MAG: hypothetical protein LUQ47_04480, partial [Methanotrichaceae archaeon]|nr:hypothetical protein [Methanotrichaceae archaeon]